jgi:hypothetical protein
VAGRIRSIEKSNDIGNRTHDLPACGIVPQPATLCCIPCFGHMISEFSFVVVIEFPHLS